MIVDRATVGTLETLGFAAWPAATFLETGGWRLQATGGPSRRVNCASPQVADAPLTLEVRREIERFYRSRAQTSLIRLTPLAPPDTDTMLAAADYRLAESCRVMVCRLDPEGSDPDAGVILTATPDAVWREGAAAAQGLDDEETAIRDCILDRILPPRAFVSVGGLRPEDPRLGFGLAVAQAGWVGLFAIVTAESARRRGVAARLVAAMLAWGRRQGARAAYLQVGADNGPARALYGRLGFVDAYPYHYRIGP